MKLPTVAVVASALLRHWGWSLGGLGAGAVAFAALHLHHDHPLPQQTAVDLGVLQATFPAFQARVDTAKQIEKAAAIRVVHDTVEDVEAAADAAFYHAQADSLRDVAEQHGDSVGVWRKLAQTEQAEIGALAADTLAKRKTITDLRVQLTAVTVRANAYESREVQLTHVNDEVAKELKHGDCSVGPFDCPSRKASFLAGNAVPLVVAGAIALVRSLHQ
jgi:hypothetical protein